MLRILIALGMVTVATVPAAAQQPAPRPLPAATVTRMRAAVQGLQENVQRGRSVSVPRPRATPPDTAFTPRPPKSLPGS